MTTEQITRMGRERKAVVQRLVSRAVKQKISSRGLARLLQHEADTLTHKDKRDWNRVAVTELTDAKARGALDAIIQQYGRGAKVFRRTGDPCHRCLGAFGPVTRPRMWVAGRIPENLKGAVHPNCRCSPWQHSAEIKKGRGIGSLKKSNGDESSIQKHNLALVDHHTLNLPKNPHEAANTKGILNIVREHALQCKDPECKKCQMHNRRLKLGFNGGRGIGSMKKAGKRALYGEIRHRKDGTYQKTGSGEWKRIEKEEDSSWNFDPKNPKASKYQQYYTFSSVAKKLGRKPTLKEIVDWWMKYEAIPEDGEILTVKAKDLIPFKEYDWSREHNRHGVKSWDELVHSIKTHGWKEGDWGTLIMDRHTRQVYLGEGNHRLAVIAKELGPDYEVPISFWGMGKGNVPESLIEDDVKKAFKHQQFIKKMKFVIAAHLKPKKISRKQWQEKVDTINGE